MKQMLRVIVVCLSFLPVLLSAQQDQVVFFQGAGTIPVGKFGATSGVFGSGDGYAMSGTAIALSYAHVFHSGWGVIAAYRWGSNPFDAGAYLKHITDTMSEKLSAQGSYGALWSIRTPMAGLLYDFRIAESFAVQPHITIGYAFVQTPSAHFTAHDSTGVNYYYEAEPTRSGSACVDVGATCNWYFTNRFYLNAMVSYFYARPYFEKVQKMSYTDNRDLNFYQNIGTINAGIGLGIKF